MYIEKEKFKIGDTVVCIKSDTSNPGITEGSLYTILKLDSVPHDELGIIVENDYGYRQFYYAHRFIKFYQIEKETEMAFTSTMNAEQIRDEILRIDVRIEEAKKDIENAQTERDSLVEKLREKGFEMLTSRTTCGSYAKVTEMNVEIGDKLILTSDSLNGILEENSEVYIAEIDFEEGTTAPFYVKDIDTGHGDWVYIDDVKFKE